MMTATATDKKAVLRDKRAQGIAAMGLVTRQGDRYEVQTPSLRGRRASYQVWRDEAGKVRCTCLEFEEGSATEPNFRCEHILAVKHSIAQKPATTVNADAKPQAAKAEISTPTNSATTLHEDGVMPTHIDTSAFEKPAPPPREQTSPQPAQSSVVETESFVRGRNEHNDEAHDPTADTDTVEVAALPSVRSLAQHTTDKEFEMKRQEAFNQSATVVADDNFDNNAQETEQAADTFAPVVPFAFANVLRTLRQPLDPKLVRTREGWTDRQGNTHLVEYIEWHTVADMLDRVYPMWSHSVRDIKQIGDIVAVTAAITIDGVTREGVGTGTADNETGIKKAEHDALKRAAIKFGIARDLYQRESEVIERTGSAPDAGEFPRDPLAKSMADLVTPKQLGMIRALAREAGVDVDEECQATLRCRAEELSKRAASSFIDHLKNMPGVAAANANAAMGSGMRRAS